jgi:RNA polymerase sigma factor (sigma-70 family)
VSARAAEAVARNAGERLYRLARSWTRCDEDAEDVVQAALLGVVRLGPDDPDEAFSYAAKSVVHLAMKIHRQRQRKPTLRLTENIAANQAAPYDLEGDVAARETIAELRRQVKPDVLRALYARGLGLEPAEIATATGLSERQVRKRIEKGRRALREGPPAEAPSSPQIARTLAKAKRRMGEDGVVA